MGYQTNVTKTKLDKPHAIINEQQPTCRQHRRTTVSKSKPKTKQLPPHDRVLFAAVLRYHSTVTATKSATKLLLHQSPHAHPHVTNQRTTTYQPNERFYAKCVFLPISQKKKNTIKYATHPTRGLSNCCCARARVLCVVSLSLFAAAGRVIIGWTLSSFILVS